MVVDFINEMESKISKLIQVVESLKGENESLKQTLSENEREVGDLRKKVSQFSNEKDEIKSRIENLLSKLEIVER
jgi:FtsZ-binding cell division protein ZapB